MMKNYKEKIIMFLNPFLLLILIKMDQLSWDTLFSAKEDLTFIPVTNAGTRVFLDILDNSVDKNGYVINTFSESKENSTEGTSLKLKEIGSISSGSKNFIKKNIVSYSEFLALKRK